MATVTYLLVGAGASGGSAFGGGGAAGIVLTGSNAITSGSFPIVVGQGGAGVGFGLPGNPGSVATSWNGHSAGAGNGGPAGNNVSGGSNASFGGGSGAGVDPSQCGGGAGAGGNGASPVNSGSFPGGDGGSGVASSISGASVTYGYGGGGCGLGAASSGHGGGGNGAAQGDAIHSPISATSATTPGSGGGGANALANSGNGADGIVILSYPTGALTAFGGNITTSGGNTIHTFTPFTDNTFRVSVVYTMSADAGSYAVVGDHETYTFLKGYLAGAYSLTGAPATFGLILAGNKIAAFPADFTLTGFNIGTSIIYAGIVSSGSYAITGSPVTFRLFISPFAPASQPLWMLERFDIKPRIEQSS